MARYITQQDVIDSYGTTRFVLLSDADGDSSPDPAAVAAAIEAAEGEVDSYLGNRYSMPLPGIVSDVDPGLNTVPATIKFRCVDIAVYRLAKDHDQLTVERRKRYDDAIQWLSDVADQTISLGIDVPPASRSGGVVRVGPDRTHQLSQTNGLV